MNWYPAPIRIKKRQPHLGPDVVYGIVTEDFGLHNASDGRVFVTHLHSGCRIGESLPCLGMAMAFVEGLSGMGVDWKLSQPPVSSSDVSLIRLSVYERADKDIELSF